ncbi:MAG TPA: hypothetical protein VGQ36_24780 [Thermoanaerobaculia bacterium]|jgi:hypothetical protein|nr:hypothetical protein [Thermoanaerobaculia bacterium]
MRRLLPAFIVFMFAAPSLMAATKSPAQKPLTNADIIALVEAGLSESIVIEKIKTSSTQFDTSTDALLKLKKAGVADGVIRLMVNPDAKTESKPVVATPWSQVAADAPAPCQVPSQGPAPWLAGNSPAMWYLADRNERVEIMYERGTIHTVGYAGFGARLLVLHPIKASLRLKPNPVFYSCINPTDAPLVKFELDQEEDERNTSVGRTTPFNQAFRISEGDLVPMTFQKTPQGFFEIKPRSNLAAGEYGFVPQASVGYFSMGERVYTFGVD